MARPRPTFPDPADLYARIDAEGRLAVKVTPGAREQSITIADDAVLVKVRAPADKGAANEAVLQLLAEALGMPPSRLTLLRGNTARQKLFAIEQT